MRGIQLKDTNKATLPAVLTRLGRKKAGLIWALRVSETRRDAEFRTHCRPGKKICFSVSVQFHVWLSLMWSGRGGMSSLCWRQSGADLVL